MNKVHKIVTDENDICFIIQTEGNSDFWYWVVSREEWNRYWLHKNPACVIGNIMEWAADEFANDIENSMLGCSCGSFESVDEAIFDYCK